MADVGGNTRREPDVVEGEVRDERVELEEERERLADTACSAVEVFSSVRRSLGGAARRGRPPSDDLAATASFSRPSAWIDLPAAPRTLTRVLARAEVENERARREDWRVAANIVNGWRARGRRRRRALVDLAGSARDKCSVLLTCNNNQNRPRKAKQPTRHQARRPPPPHLKPTSPPPRPRCR